MAESHFHSRFFGMAGTLCLAALFALASLAEAASPNLGVVLPRGGQRGTEITVTLNGARLSDAKEIMFYTPGIQVKSLKAVNDAQVSAVLKIAPDCQLGEKALRLRTASGISELATFYVGALPNVEEKEPNSEFTSPQKIPLNVTVNGVVDNEDVDYYQIEAKKGQRVTAEVEGIRIGTTLFDPYVAILDRKRFELAASDDTALLRQDPVASVVIPEDGKYIVQVRESAYGGNGSCYYRLHVGTFPRPLALLPAGGKAGEEVEVRFLGDVGGEIRQKVKVPALHDPSFGLFAQDAGGISPSPNLFRISEFGNVLEVEPNDTHAQATPVELPKAINGVISQKADVDCFRFKMKKGQTYDVQCYARRLGSPLDPVVTISYFNGGALVANDDAIGPDSYIRFTAPEDKEYVLSVTDHLGKGGPTYFYRIEFTPIRPQLAMSIPKLATYSQERQNIPVPRGNRYATLITATRTDFSGALVLGTEGLPKGVTAQWENMPANLDTIPVVFEAAADAPVVGTFANLTGRHIDPGTKIQGGFFQSVELVAIINQGIFWKHDVDRAVVAVTEEVPFKIKIVEPKVPLVQNGAMNLKVVAERKAGYKAPITVQMLFNPPGVGSASAATINEGQKETVIPINANSAAEIRKWKIAVIGSATVGNGPVWVSSQLANLEIAAPFLTLNLERAAGEQGKGTDLFCKVQHNTPFPGSAKVHLVGLPNKVVAADIDITKDTKEFAFKVTIDKASPAGQHKNLFCQVNVMQNGEPVLHNLGGSELRIDVPLPPKAAAPAAPMVVAAAKPAAPPKVAPVEKRLTRLEKLRLEQEERERTTRSASPGK